MIEMICENCKWWYYDEAYMFYGDHVCVNGDSEYAAEFTMSKDCCDEW